MYPYGVPAGLAARQVLTAPPNVHPGGHRASVSVKGPRLRDGRAIRVQGRINGRLGDTGGIRAGLRGTLTEPSSVGGTSGCVHIILDAQIFSRLGVTVRVTELKYVVLQPVYQIIREPGWSLRV